MSNAASVATATTTMERANTRAYDSRLYADDLLESFGFGFSSTNYSTEEEGYGNGDEY